MAIRRKKTLETPRRRRLRRKIFIIKIVFFGILGLLLLLGGVYLLRLPYFAIDEIEVRGTDRVNQEEVVEMVREISSGNVMFVIPRKQFFVYPKVEIKEKLTQGFNQIKQVKLEKQGLQKVIITVEEYAPAVRYCGTRCVLVDDQGFIYKDLIENEYGLLPTIYAGEETEIVLFEYVISKEKFVDLFQFKERLASLDFTFKQINREQDGSMRFVLEQGDIIISVDESLENQFGSLQAVLGEIDQFAYIDLRFGKKVFYEEK